MLAALLISACVRPREQVQPLSGSLFRQRWWNYYQRALDGAEARDYAAARADLAVALRQRDSDQRMARTCGMHFIDAIRLGNLTAAQAVVAGSLVETRIGMEIVGRVIDSETGKILCTADVFGEVKTLPGLKILAQALTLKLHREFPLVDGMIVDRQADLIVTDLTLEKLRA